MKVVFKTLKHNEHRDNCIALLTDTLENGNLNYRGLFGEEGTVSRDWVRRQGRNSRVQEYQSLKTELERTGIKIEIVKSL